MSHRGGRRKALELGLGLLSIGTTWGVAQTPPPARAQAERLILAALNLGIRSLDTAPAYGASEQILGSVLGATYP